MPALPLDWGLTRGYENMELEDLKEKSSRKVLLKGTSARGKTLNSAKVALGVAMEGAEVLYIDLEAEGSTTMVELIENDEFPAEALDTLEYHRVNSYDQLDTAIGQDNQEKFDLIVVDPLDHKHNFAIEKVTGDTNKAAADWNEYLVTYDYEMKIMEKIGKSSTNVLATIDPQSGKSDKPKGAQTNVHGYFSVVVKLTKEGDREWGNVVKNFVGKSHVIGHSLSDEKDLHDNVTKALLDYIQL